MTWIAEVEGIGEVYASRLAEAGIVTQQQLLEICGEPLGRKRVAQESGIANKLVMKWANRADLARIRGVGGEYVDLLACAGVDTVSELAQRNAVMLFDKLAEVNEQKSLVRNLPSADQVAEWISQAQRLPCKISY